MRGRCPATRAVARLVDFATNVSTRHISTHPVVAGARFRSERGRRRLAIMVNIGVALLLGMLDARVLYRLRRDRRLRMVVWMQYGAWTMSLKSGLVRGFYDYIFGYDTKDDCCRRRNLDPGVLAPPLRLQGVALLQAERDDGRVPVRAPLRDASQEGRQVSVLQPRRKALLSADKKSIEKIDIGVQAYSTMKALSAADRPAGRQKLAKPSRLRAVGKWRRHLSTLLRTAGPRISLEHLGRGQTKSEPRKGRIRQGDPRHKPGRLEKICADLPTNTPRGAKWSPGQGVSDARDPIVGQYTRRHPIAGRPRFARYGFRVSARHLGRQFPTGRQEMWHDAKPVGFGYFVGNVSRDDTPLPTRATPFPSASSRARGRCNMGAQRPSNAVARV